MLAGSRRPTAPIRIRAFAAVWAAMPGPAIRETPPARPEPAGAAPARTAPGAPYGPAGCAGGPGARPGNGLPPAGRRAGTRRAPRGRGRDRHRGRTAGLRPASREPALLGQALHRRVGRPDGDALAEPGRVLPQELEVEPALAEPGPRRQHQLHLVRGDAPDALDDRRDLVLGVDVDRFSGHRAKLRLSLP